MHVYIVLPHPQEKGEKKKKKNEMNELNLFYNII